MADMRGGAVEEGLYWRKIAVLVESC